MQHESVKKLFKEQVNRYVRKGQVLDSSIIPLVLRWLRNKNSKTIDICEFGGGAGQLLNELQKKFPNIVCTNVEIIDDYKAFCISKKIKYVTSSVLNSGFKDNTFDIIIMRDVLHHLVGNNYKETQSNQRRALYELKRLTKPGGAIFIEELTNESEMATRIMYYLTKINAAFSYASFLKVNSNTIIAFLTPAKLKSLCEEVFGKEKINLKLSYGPRKIFELSWILHLGARTPKATVVIKR